MPVGPLGDTVIHKSSLAAMLKSGSGTNWTSIDVRSSVAIGGRKLISVAIDPLPKLYRSRTIVKRSASHYQDVD
jgi:hypothetical protein